MASFDDLAQAHADRLDSLSEELSSRVGAAVDQVVLDLATTIRQRLRKQKTQQAPAVLGIQEDFAKAVAASGYNQVVAAYVSMLSDEVDEFELLYGEMASGLPTMRLTAQDIEALSAQASAAMAVVDGHAEQVGRFLGQLLSRSLGAFDAGRLTRDVAEVARRLTAVAPLAKDQAATFFRTVGALVYRGLEQDRRLRYSYVGRTRPGSRDFCKGLGGKEFSLAEVDALDNSQTPDALSNAGGYGCMHFWRIAA
jgi:hypothetical protein